MWKLKQLIDLFNLILHILQATFCLKFIFELASKNLLKIYRKCFLDLLLQQNSSKQYIMQAIFSFSSI